MHGDELRVALRAESRESAGHDGVAAVCGGDEIDAEDGGLGGKLGAVPRRSGAQFHALLRRPEMRGEAYLLANRAGVGGRVEACAEVAKGGTEFEGVEVLQDVIFARLLPAPPRRDAGHEERLAEDVAREAGQKCHERRALQQAGAERIRDGDVARAHGFHEAGDAERGVAAQLQRVAEVVVEPPEDHVHGL